jgi:predicted phosphodiesterase
MKKIALLTDIHANLPALLSVLREVKESGATEIVFLGDIVGYGASPAECVQWVRKLGGHCVMGNHDLAVPYYRENAQRRTDPRKIRDGYLAGLIHAAETLAEEDAEWLMNLPYVMEIPGAWIAHASIDDPKNFNYVEDQESAADTLNFLSRMEIKLGFFGHTHVPNIFAEDASKLEWINDSTVRIPGDMACAVTVGSCGQPRTRDDLRACWALWNPEERIVEFRRTEYNRIKAAQDAAKAGLPLEAASRVLTDAEFAELCR